MLSARCCGCFVQSFLVSGDTHEINFLGQKIEAFASYLGQMVDRSQHRRVESEGGHVHWHVHNAWHTRFSICLRCCMVSESKDAKIGIRYRCLTGVQVRLHVYHIQLGSPTSFGSAEDNAEVSPFPFQLI